MQVLQIQVYPMVDGRNTVRVTAKNDAGQIIIGVSAPFGREESSKVLPDLIKKMDATQGNVPHITPLGKE